MGWRLAGGVHQTTIFDDTQYFIYADTYVITPPIAEIIWVKNVKAIVVCGFLMK